MSPRDLAIRAAVNLLAAMACLLMLLAVTLRGLLVELADDVRVSRNESKTNNRLQGWKMSQKKNTRLTDSVSMMRAANAVLAARVGDTARAQAVLAEAEFYAGNASIPMRRAS